MARYVSSVVAELLGRSAPELDVAAPFKDLGVDSLVGLRLRNRLARDLAVPLSPTSVYRFPTVTDLSAHLLTQI